MEESTPHTPSARHDNSPNDPLRADGDGLFDGPDVEEVTHRRGWLTDRDREYLLDKSDIEPRSDRERQIRRRLRQRLVGGFLDMILIERHLDARDRERVLDHFDAEKLLSGGVTPDMNLLDHLRAFDYLFAFLWRGLKGRQPTFRDRLEGGIIRGEHDPGSSPGTYDRYNVTITVEEAMPPDTPINYADLAVLLAEGPRRSGKISRDTLDQLLAAIEQYDPNAEELDAAIDVLAGQADINREPGDEQDQDQDQE